ncbi:hypothetical protein SNE40_019878 [Patella caerulea]|uniref:Uncharacterized protein n=1 Tax=Patella caerulea TaxID=87958 RepID=A0AAN8G9J1_PATCE
MKSTETEPGTGGGVELDCDLFKVDALSKLSYFMSDRAAIEKKANELMNNWVQEELKKADAPATVVHSMYCMAHVLLGFHRYSEASLKELQAEPIAEGGKIGKDDDGAYFRFKTELGVTRIVRMVSEILGPNVVEKSGVRN